MMFILIIDTYSINNKESFSGIKVLKWYALLHNFAEL